ncbi:MAG: endonuclease domain-containing protein [Methylocystis sp.]
MDSLVIPCISPDVAANEILHAGKGAMLTFVGEARGLRAAFDIIETAPRQALFLHFRAVVSAEAMVERTLDLLGEALLRLRPARSDAAFPPPSGEAETGLSPGWTAAAARRIAAGRIPRVRALSPAAELAQLTLAIDPRGVALIADLEPCDAAAALAGLEWIARHAAGPLAIVLPEAPPQGSPFERVMHGARVLGEIADASPTDESGGDLWLAPWRGAPHPLSDIERRVAEPIRRDDELTRLFTFNATVRTTRGTLARVDLLWAQGRLVVELDGWPDHGRREAFVADRRRDYALAASDYLVLRLTNDDIETDLAREIEKIRDLVHLRRRTRAIG